MTIIRWDAVKKQKKLRSMSVRLLDNGYGLNRMQNYNVQKWLLENIGAGNWGDITLMERDDKWHIGFDTIGYPTIFFIAKNDYFTFLLNFKNVIQDGKIIIN